jgi:hypothetical protein
MVFNATFNNISVISWLSVLLVEETGVPRENHRPAVSHWQTLSHNILSSTPRHEWGSTLVVIGTDCTGSCKSNYHTITTTSVPKFVDRKGFTSRTLLLNFYGDNAFTKPEFYFFFRHEKSIFFFKCHQNFSLKTAGSDNFFF